MRILPRSVVALSTAALASAGLALGAGTASAALTTYCDGEGADVTVPGDLVVAKGDACVLDNVLIEGSVRVQAGADLLLTETTVDGKVTVAADGYFDSTYSEIGEGLVSHGGYGVYLDASSVTGALQVREGEDADPFLYAYDSSVGGKVAVEQGLVHLQTVTVGGHVTTSNTEYTDVIDSTLSRDVTVSGAAEGSAVCGSEIDGAAVFTGNGGMQLGTGGALIDCEDGNYFGGDVTIADTTDGVDVSTNIIRGALSGEGNDPAPTGSENRVRGGVSGQFTDLAPAGQARTLSATAEDHAEELDALRAERSGEAERAAEQAGPAQLR